jgi:hypothetical protein
MVRFIGHQHNLAISEIIKGHSVFFWSKHIHVKPLRSGEVDVYGVRVAVLKIFDFSDSNFISVNGDILSKQIFCSGSIQEVLFRFFNDV